MCTPACGRAARALGCATGSASSPGAAGPRALRSGRAATPLRGSGGLPRTLRHRGAVWEVPHLGLVSRGMCWLSFGSVKSVPLAQSTAGPRVNLCLRLPLYARGGECGQNTHLGGTLCNNLCDPVEDASEKPFCQIHKRQAETPTAVGPEIGRLRRAHGLGVQLEPAFLFESRVMLQKSLICWSMTVRLPEKRSGSKCRWRCFAECAGQCLLEGCFLDVSVCGWVDIFLDGHTQGV